MPSFLGIGIWVNKLLRINKHSGPDGCLATYYKRFVEYLAPLLIIYFNNLLWQNSFEIKTLTAIISLMPKFVKMIASGPIIGQ